jgi:hypothetical protein
MSIVSLVPRGSQKSFELGLHLLCTFLLLSCLEEPTLKLSLRGRPKPLQLNHSMKQICTGCRQIGDLTRHLLIEGFVVQLVAILLQAAHPV